MIYIVRHGKTDWNAGDKIQGRRDIPLNGAGIAQAKETAKRLNSISFFEVYSSPLKRAAETAEIISGRKPILDKRLTERDFGSLEGQPLNTEQFLNMWRTDTKDCPIDIESIGDIMVRLRDFFDGLKTIADKDVLVVTHGGIMMVMRLLIEGEPASGSLLDYLPDNAGYFVFDGGGLL